MRVERVFVAGAGLMGHGIAQVFAAAGKPVRLYEPDLGRAVAGRERIAGNLERAVAKGRLASDEAAAILARIGPTDRLADAADADLAIEAIVEDLGVKADLWRELDRVAPPDAIRATNTSSLSIDRLAEAIGVERRARFLGMHFFSPAPVMPLVELVRGGATDDATVAAVRALAEELGKTVIVAVDRPGFVVNRMLFAFLAEAIRIHEEGLASPEEIDTGARVGLNHPMGPFELADFIGLDVCLETLRAIHDGLGAEQFEPPRTLAELVAAGHLGQKTGRGFYVHPRPGRP